MKPSATPSRAKEKAGLPIAGPRAVLESLAASFRAAAGEEAQAWQRLQSSRETLIGKLVEAGDPAAPARQKLCLLEGRTRLDPSDQEQQKALQDLAESAGPEAVAAWFGASQAYADASDRAFRRASELADHGGIGLRADQEALSDMGLLKRRLLAIAARINPTLDVRFVRELYGEGPALIASGAGSTARMPVAGMYEPFYHLATISLDPRYDREDSAFHESFHSIERVLTPEERRQLAKAFPPKDGMTTSERAAIAFAAWATRQQRLEEMGIRAEDIRGIRNGFRKMALFAGRSAQAFHAAGINHPSDLAAKLPSAAAPIFHKIMNGEMGRRSLVSFRDRPAAFGGSLQAASFKSGDAQMLGSGELTLSKSGRGLDPFPQVRLNSEASTLATLKRVDAWLLAEALKEAEATRDDWGKTLFKGLKPDALSPSDRDSLNLYLFGQEQGPTQRQILRPLDPQSVKRASAIADGSALRRSARHATHELFRRSEQLSFARTPALAKPVRFRYRLMEADQVMPSHQVKDGVLIAATGYPAGLQPRDRSRAASALQISQMAANLDPRLLGPSVTLTEGCPLIGPDGICESGNGRLAALRLVYDDPAFRARASDYRNRLRGLGLEIEGFDKPVLVRQRVTRLDDAERAALAAIANEPTTLSLSVTERALIDAARISRATLGLWRGGDLQSAPNRGFVKALVADIATPTDTGAMALKTGALSLDGLRRVEAALLARAYGDPSLLATLLERTDNQIRGIGGALLDAAPAWAQLRGDVAAGSVRPETDVTAELVKSVEAIAAARQVGQRLNDRLSQDDLLDREGRNRPDRAVLRLFFRNDELTRPASREAIAEALSSYAARAARLTSGGELLGEEHRVEPRDILQDTAPKLAPALDQGDLLARFSTGVFRAPVLPEFDPTQAKPATHWLIEQGHYSEYATNKFDAFGWYDDYSTQLAAREKAIEDGQLVRRFPATHEQTEAYIEDHGLRELHGERCRQEAMEDIASEQKVSAQELQRLIETDPSLKERVDDRAEDYLWTEAQNRMEQEGVFDESAAEDELSEGFFYALDELLQEELDQELRDAVVIPSSNDTEYFLVRFPNDGFEVWSTARHGVDFVDGTHLGLDTAVSLARKHALTGREYLQDTDKPLNPQATADEWKRGTARAQLPWQYHAERRPALLRGDFAIVGPDRYDRSYRSRQGWRIIHLASGLCVAPPFTTVSKAKQVAVGLQPLRQDWSALTLDRLTKEGGFGADFAVARGRLLNAIATERRLRRGRLDIDSPGISSPVSFSTGFSTGVAPSAYDRGQRSIREFQKALASVDDRFTASQNFSSFLELSRVALLNGMLPNGSEAWKKNEDAFRACLSRYGKEWDDQQMRAAQKRFADMLGMTAIALEDGQPILGMVAGEIGHLNPRQGQFFTPMEISRLMARVNMDDISGIREKIARDGAITILDPACGDGRMIMAAAETLRENGIDPRQMQATMIDINGDTAKMAFIHAGLSGIPAAVIHGNGLTFEEFDRWLTPAAQIQLRQQIPTGRHEVAAGPATTAMPAAASAAAQDADRLSRLRKTRADISFEQPDLLSGTRREDTAYSLGRPAMRLSPVERARILEKRMQRHRAAYSIGNSSDTGEPGMGPGANDNSVAARYLGLANEQIRQNQLQDLFDDAVLGCYEAGLAAGLGSPTVVDLRPAAGPNAHILNLERLKEVMDEVDHLRDWYAQGDVDGQMARFQDVLKADRRIDAVLSAWHDAYPGQQIGSWLLPSYSAGRPAHAPVQLGRIVTDPTDGTLRAEIVTRRDGGQVSDWRSGFASQEEIEKLLQQEFGERFKPRLSTGLQAMRGLPQTDALRQFEQIGASRILLAHFTPQQLRALAPEPFGRDGFGLSFEADPGLDLQSASRAALDAVWATTGQLPVPMLDVAASRAARLSHGLHPRDTAQNVGLLPASAAYVTRVNHDLQALADLAESRGATAVAVAIRVDDPGMRAWIPERLAGLPGPDGRRSMIALSDDHADHVPIEQISFKVDGVSMAGGVAAGLAGSLAAAARAELEGIPRFDSDSYELIEPDEEEIDDLARERESEFHSEVFSEYLDRHGYSFIVTQSELDDLAADFLAEARTKAEREGISDEDALEERAMEIARGRAAQALGHEVGDVNENKLLEAYGDAIQDEAWERAQAWARNLSSQDGYANRLWKDVDGLGYEIAEAGHLFRLTFQKQLLAETVSFQRAAMHAQMHARGEADVERLTDDTQPLNPVVAVDAWRRIEPIRISAGGKACLLVGGVIARGSFAVHRTQIDGMADRGWVVTHLPSGLRAGAALPRVEDAIAWADRLMSIDTPWPTLVRGAVDGWKQAPAWAGICSQAMKDRDGVEDAARKAAREEARKIRDRRLQKAERQVGGTAAFKVEPVKPGQTEQLNGSTQIRKLRAMIADRLNRGGFRDRFDLRAAASNVLAETIRPGTRLAKDVEEIAEAVAVRSAVRIEAAAARRASQADSHVFEKIEQLYDRLPLLATRSSTSMRNQAYSTPLPLAWIAKRLLAAAPEHHVVEPAAGHGALLIGLNPKQVSAFEIDPSRAEELRLQGYRVTEGDVLSYRPAAADRIIANPPFGRIPDGPSRVLSDGKNVSQTRQLDRAIAWHALESLKADGRAVLVLAGERSPKGYRSRDSRGFYKLLYDNFNVTDHLQIDGKLYRGQGAGWPVDLIVIDGRGKSALPYPSAAMPSRIGSWQQLHDHFAGRLSVIESDRKRAPKIAPPQAVVQYKIDVPAPVVRGINLEDAIRQAKAEATPETAQLDYEPASAGPRIGTKVPANLAEPMRRALANLGRQVGDVDAFVAEKIGYETKEKLWQALKAEQVDAVALGIRQIEQGGSFINGDQTGGGKGRVQAALIRYALRNNLVPFFVTERPDLYAAMARDLAALGLQDLRIFVSNDDLRGSKAIDMPGGSRLESLKPEAHAAKLEEIARTGKLDGFDAFFTCYSQAQTVAGADTLRRRAMRALLQNGNVLQIRDEVHNAGGDEERVSKAGQPKNRAEFIRELQWNASAVIDSSATYAKRPGSLDLFGRTDLRRAVREPGQIGAYVAAGGTGLQQMVAAQLSEAGQYARRERDMAGLEYRFEKVAVDRQAAEGLSEALAKIQLFDARKQEVLRGDLLKQLLREAKAVLADPSTGQPGMHSTHFTALMHNIINQGLLSLQADADADRMIAHLQSGKKPIYGLQNTMGAFLEGFAADHGLKPGDPLPANFGDILKRYLERSRDVLIGDAFGDKERRRLSDAELGPAAMRAYRDALKAIDAVDWSKMPVSPIDHVKHRVRQAGYSIEEITGRKLWVDYSGTEPVLRARSDAETSKSEAVRIRDRFNDGSTDAAVVNQSGASGIDLHASRQFKDQRQRVWVVGQAHQNIDTHIQMLGRPDRLDQVSKPIYEHPVADIPAVIRPASILARKLKSLNASVSGAQFGPFSSSAEDLFNSLGDQAAARLMEMDTLTHARLGYPLDFVGESGRLNHDNAARKVTGRFVLLPLRVQSMMWDALATEFRAEREAARAMGRDTDEAPVLALNARPMTMVAISDGNAADPSPLRRPAYAYLAEVDVLQKPYRWTGVGRRVAELNRLAGANDVDKAREKLQPAAAAQLADTEKSYRTWLAQRMERFARDPKGEAKGKAYAARHNEQMALVRQLLTQFTPGRGISLTLPGNGEDPFTIHGVVGRIRSVQRPGLNPAQPAAWRVTFIVADGMRELELPLSQIALGSAKAQGASVGLMRAESVLVNGKRLSLMELFDRSASVSREKRVIIAGNVLAGFHAAGARGRPVYFTDHTGARHAGILMPRQLELEALRPPVRIAGPDQAITYLGRAETSRKNPSPRRIVSNDGAIVIRNVSAPKAAEPVFQIAIAGAKAIGGKYSLDRALTAVTGDFVSSGDMMVADVDAPKLAAAFRRMQEIGAEFVARGDEVKAAAELGIAQPAAIPVNSFHNDPVPVAANRIEARPAMADRKNDPAPAVQLPERKYQPVSRRAATEQRFQVPKRNRPGFGIEGFQGSFSTGTTPLPSQAAMRRAAATSEDLVRRVAGLPEDELKKGKADFFAFQFGGFGVLYGAAELYAGLERASQRAAAGDAPAARRVAIAALGHFDQAVGGMFSAGQGVERSLKSCLSFLPPDERQQTALTIAPIMLASGEVMAMRHCLVDIANGELGTAREIEQAAQDALRRAGDPSVTAAEREAQQFDEARRDLASEMLTGFGSGIADTDPEVSFSTGVTEWGAGYEQHPDYFHYAPHRDSGAGRLSALGWVAADVAIATKSGLRAMPGLVHAEIPGVTLLPAPAFGVDAEDFDRNEIRWRMAQAGTGILIGTMGRDKDGQPVSPMLFTPEAAAEAARRISGAADWVGMRQEDLNQREKNRIAHAVQKALTEVREQDRRAWIERGIAEFAPERLREAGFRLDSVWWLPVDDPTLPEPPAVPGAVQVFDDKDAAADFDGREAVPVYVRFGKVADLSEGRDMHPSARTALWEFFDQNQQALRTGIWQRTYDEVSFDDPEDAEEKANEAAENFDFEQFIEGLSHGDFSMAGDYEGDLKDYVTETLGNADFDTVIIPSMFDMNSQDVMVLRPSSLQFAWDEIEPAMLAAEQRAREAAERDAAWREKYSEAERARMAAERDLEVSEFDLGSLSESGFDTGARDILWLPADKAEFATVPETDGIELLARRSDAEPLKMEAAPVYVRRGRVADLTAIGREMMDIMQDVALSRTPPADALHWKRQIEAGGIDGIAGLRDDLRQAFQAEGYHALRYPTPNGVRTLVFDPSDVTIAWDVLARGKLERRMADLQAGPALTAARRAAALAAPMLRLGGPEGSDPVTAPMRTALDVAEFARGMTAAGAILIFRDEDGGARIFDGDARRAAGLVPGLSLLETGEGEGASAVIRLAADAVEDRAAGLAMKHDAPVVVVGIDAQGRIHLETFEGDRHVSETFDASREAELSAPARVLERQKAARAASWQGKSLTGKYRDLANAARRHEIPALKDGSRYVIAGDRAAQAGAAHPLLSQRLTGADAERITWISDNPQELMEVGQALADNGLTLALAENYDRRGWSVFTLQRRNAEVRTEQAAIDDVPRFTSGFFEILKPDHQQQLLLVAYDGDESWRSYGRDAEALSRLLGQPLGQETAGDGSVIPVLTLSRAAATASAASLTAQLGVEGYSAIVLAEIVGDASAAHVNKTELKPPAPSFQSDASAEVRDVEGDRRRVADQIANSQTAAPAGEKAGLQQSAAHAAALEQAARMDPPPAPEPVLRLWQQMKAARGSRIVIVRDGSQYRSFGRDAETMAEICPRLTAAYDTFQVEGRAMGRVTFGEWQSADIIADLNRVGRGVTVAGLDPQGVPQTREYEPAASQPLSNASGLSAAPQPARISGEAGLSLEERMLREAQAKAASLPPPTNAAALRIHLDEALGHIAALGDGPRNDQITQVLVGRGLLNTSLHREMAKVSREIYPLNAGYVIWRHPATRHWHVDSFGAFVEKMGPDGPLHNSFPKRAADILRDFSGDYLRQLDAAFANDLAGVKSEIQQMAQEINPNAEVAFVDRLFADGKTVVEGGAETADRQPVLGLYFRLYQLIAASTDITRGDPRETVLHELFHDVEDLLGPAEKAILAERFPARGGMTSSERCAEAFAKWAMHRYGLKPVPASVQSEEGRSRMRNALLRGGDSRPASSARHETTVHAVAARTHAAVSGSARNAEADLDRSFAPVARFLERSSNLLKRRGFATWDDVFERIRRGEIAGKARIFDVSAEVEPEEAARLARLADLNKLAEALDFYASRVDRRGLTGQGVYSLLRNQLSDQEILQLLHKAGYSGLRDPGYATPLLSTRSAIAGAELERHRRVTPIEIAQAPQRSSAYPPSSSAPAYPSAGGQGFAQSRNAAGYASRPAWGVRSYSAGLGLEPIRSESGPDLVTVTLEESYSRKGLDMLEVGHDNTGIHGYENMPRKPAILPELPQDLVPLYIPHSDYIRLRERGIWPREEDAPGKLILDTAMGENRFLIARDHPAFDKLKSYATEASRERWSNALREVQSLHAAITGRTSQVREQDRIYLYVPAADLPMIRGVPGADFARDSGLWFIAKDHPRAVELARDYASDDAVKVWASERLALARDQNQKLSAAGLVAPAATIGAAYGLSRSADLAAVPANLEKLGHEAAVTAGQMTDQAKAGMSEAATALSQETARLGEKIVASGKEVFDKTSAEAAAWKAEAGGFVASMEEAAGELGEGLDRTARNAQAVAAIHADSLQTTAGQLTGQARDAASEIAATIADGASRTADSVDAALKSGQPAAEQVAGAVSAKAAELGGMVLDGARIAAETTPAALATAKATGATLIAKIGASGSELVSAVSTKLGGVATSAAATADVALSAGLMGAAVGTAIWAAKRSNRLKEYERVARVAPWTLTEKEFGQVASRLYRLERSKKDGLHTAILVDRKTNEPVFSQMSTDKAPSAREMTSLAHLHACSAARREKVHVPDRVVLSHALDADRPGRSSAGADHVRVIAGLMSPDKARPLGEFHQAAQLRAAALKWREQVPEVKLSPKAGVAERRAIAAELKKMPADILDGTLARTAAVGRSRTRADERSLYANGRLIVETEQRERLAATARSSRRSRGSGLSI